MSRWHRVSGDGTRCVHGGHPDAVPGAALHAGPVLATAYHLGLPGEPTPEDYYGRASNPTWRALESVIGELGPRDGLVVQWLLARSALDPASIDPLRLVSGLVDVLASALDRVGPSEVLACLEKGGPDEQIAVLSEIWRLDHPRLAEVLKAIGTHHGVKAVAKAARRASMKYRSRIASR